MRTIDRPDLRALTPIGECERLMKAIDALCLRCGTSSAMCPPVKSMIDKDGICQRTGTCPECWKAWAMEKAK